MAYCQALYMQVSSLKGFHLIKLPDKNYLVKPYPPTLFNFKEAQIGDFQPLIHVSRQ